MHSMFYKCENFDSDLSGWDVSNVNDMGEMFKDCTKFTGKGLENWKPIKCEDMGCMFYNCVNFDSDLSGWNISNVEYMGEMFKNCTIFTGNGLDEWKPIKCKDISHMFDKCNSLNNYPSWYKNKYLK